MEPPLLNKKTYYRYFEFDFTNKTILDIGSSIGSFHKSKKFKITESEILEAKSNTTLDIDPLKNPDIVADVHMISEFITKDSVDIIIMNNIIEHLKNPEVVIDQIFTLLKDSGCVYFTVPFMYPIHEKPNDFSRFTKYKLDLLFSDFENVEIFHLGEYFSVFSNFIFLSTKIFNNNFFKKLFQLLVFPICFLIIQIDRFTVTEDFPIIYYGKLTKFNSRTKNDKL